MRRATIVLVAVMVVLAGCSSGGNGGTEDPETTMSETPDTGQSGDVDVTTTADSSVGSDGESDSGSGSDGETASDSESSSESDSDAEDGSEGDSGSESDGNPDGDSTADEARSTLATALNNTGQFEEPYRVEMTLVNGSTETRLTLVNDTERQLIVLDEPSREDERTYYLTEGPDAVRNSATGEVRYGSGESRIERTGGFAAGFTFVSGLLFVGIMDWEPAGETTVDGETARVFEADSVNRTAIDQGDFLSGISEVNSGEGRLVVDQTTIRSASVTVDTSEETINLDLTIETGSDISVERPDWVDDDEFERLQPVGVGAP